jgi:hypothetical protein
MFRKSVAICERPARVPLEPDSDWWTRAFYAFTPVNPCTPALIAGLAQSLPARFIRVVYLDRYNCPAIDGHLAWPDGITQSDASRSRTRSRDVSLLRVH